MDLSRYLILAVFHCPLRRCPKRCLACRKTASKPGSPNRSAAAVLTFQQIGIWRWLFPVNISFDINDRLSIIGQFGVVGAYDLANKRVEAGAQPAIFGSWSF